MSVYLPGVTLLRSPQDGPVQESYVRSRPLNSTLVESTSGTYDRSKGTSESD